MTRADRRPSGLLASVARAVLHEVRDRLGEDGITVLPVKGIVTQRLLYGPGEDRHLLDIDVRVRPSDLPRVIERARKSGWKQLDRYYTYGAVTFEVGGLDVDIETHCGPPGFAKLRVDDMMARATEDPVLGLVPEIHDHTIALVINVCKDHLTAARPWALEDLRRIVVYPTLSIERVIAHSVETRTRGMLYLVASRLLDVPEWAALRSRMGDVGWNAYPRFYDWLLDHSAPRNALRLGARALSDGIVRSALSIGRAGIFEIERAAQRFSTRND